MAGPHLEVLVYGLGAIGSFYTFILSRSENVRLTVVARSNYGAVSANGIHITSQNHGDHHVRPHRVVRTVAEAAAAAGKKIDYIICANKAIDQAEVPEQLAPAVDETKTTIVIIQNGVGNEEPLRARFPDATIISCVTWVCARQPQPGIITHTTSEDMQLGLYPRKTKPNTGASSEISPTSSYSTTETTSLHQFSSLLTEGKTVFQLVPDIQVQRWEKVAWNAAWNPLTTLTLLDTHAWLASSDGAVALTRRVIQEVVDVARAAGVKRVDAGLVDRHMDKIRSMPPIGSSMRTDCEKGRPLEVEMILGYPVRKGRELGVRVEALEMLYALVGAVNGRLVRARE